MWDCYIHSYDKAQHTSRIIDVVACSNAYVCIQFIVWWTLQKWTHIYCLHLILIFTTNRFFSPYFKVLVNVLARGGVFKLFEIKLSLWGDLLCFLNSKFSFMEICRHCKILKLCFLWSEGLCVWKPLSKIDHVKKIAYYTFISHW